MCFLIKRLTTLNCKLIVLLGTFLCPKNEKKGGETSIFFASSKHRPHTSKHMAIDNIPNIQGGKTRENSNNLDIHSLGK